VVTWRRAQMVLLSAQSMPVMIRRYISWRNRHAGDTRLRQVVAWASAA
jgi:hypothetical protein